MLKKRIVHLFIALALFVTTTISVGLFEDELGWQITAPVQACSSSSGSGGDC